MQKIGLIVDAHLGCADYTNRRRADFVTAFKNAITTCLGGGAETLCLLSEVFDSALTRRSDEAFATTMRHVAPVLQRLKSRDGPRRRDRKQLRISGVHAKPVSVAFLTARPFSPTQGDSVPIEDRAIVSFPLAGERRTGRYARPRPRVAAPCPRRTSRRLQRHPARAAPRRRVRSGGGLDQPSRAGASLTAIAAICGGIPSECSTPTWR